MEFTTQQEGLEKIKRAYAALETSLQESGQGLVFRTEKGIYGTTSCDVLFTFFKKIGLSEKQRFLDIGSGDGRAVLIASLFTPHVTGIEIDDTLVAHGLRIAHELNMVTEHMQFMWGDFLKDIDFSGYDIIFSNPDQEFSKGLGEKLSKEMQRAATLYIRNEIFVPETLRKGKKIWIDQLPIIEYHQVR